MRVLHVFDHSLPLHSGYAFRSAAILRGQRALGWETVQLTTPRHGASARREEEVDGLTFLRTTFAPGWRSRVPVFGRYVDEMRATEARVAEIIERAQPDLLHAHSPVLNALPAIAAARRHGLPVVYEVRACWEDAAVDHGSTREGSLRYRATRALETHALRRADAVTVICDGLRREFVARGIPADKITVIPNAVEVQDFRFGAQPDPQLRVALGLEGATILGFVGSFYAYEGLDLLLQALAKLLPQRPQLRALLVGGGPQEDALRRLAQDLGISDKVVFTGRVPHSQVQRYYDLIDVLAYPRHPMRLTELVTPLKPLEAMAQGRILLASDVGGHRELIRDGDTGYLFAAGRVEALMQAIERVLSERSAWDAMRLRARRFVELERTWTQSVARYRDVYGRLLARAAGNRAVPAVH